jgi:uncharacterized RDD family membrane protein YckC
MKLTIKRGLAFLIDYCIIATYGLMLFGGVMVAQALFQFEIPVLSPVSGQLLGFISLTFPVLLYFFLSEKGKHQGTIGKRILKIRVDGDYLLLRSILKFIPWEIAHAGVLWLFYYENAGIETPIWVWILLLLPQLLVVIYFITLLAYKGEQSVYDKIAHTRVYSL